MKSSTRNYLSNKNVNTIVNQIQRMIQFNVRNFTNSHNVYMYILSNRQPLPEKHTSFKKFSCMLH